jgi:hypothetical protein
MGVPRSLTHFVVRTIAPRRRRESIPATRNIDQLLPVVIAKDQCVNILRARRVSADHESLPLVDADLEQAPKH